MVCMDKLDQVLAVDPVGLTITAQAGIRLDKLYSTLKSHKLALAVLPNTDKLRLCGIIANTAHGTNLHEGSVCSLVTELDIVVADGRVLHLRADAPVGSKERDYFESAISSVGHLGVMYSVTLRCVPDYNVIVYEKATTHTAVLGNLKHIFSRHGALQIFVSPPQKLALAKLQTPIDPIISHAMTRDWLVDTFTECFLHARKPGKRKFWKNLVGTAIGVVIRYFPTLYSSVAGTVKVMKWDDGEIAVKSFKDPAFLNCEYALPIDSIDEACFEIMRISDEFEKKGYYRKAGWLMRPVKGDTHGFLSPVKGDTPRIYIDIPYQQMDQVEFDYICTIERELVRLGGRVSWARRFNLPYEEVMPSYEDLDKFKAVVRELDPTNTFTSAMRQGMLGF